MSNLLVSWAMRWPVESIDSSSSSRGVLDLRRFRPRVASGDGVLGVDGEDACRIGGNLKTGVAMSSSGVSLSSSLIWSAFDNPSSASSSASAGGSAL